MLERVESDPNILDYVVTGDESWVYQYDPETKRQSEEWHTSASPRPKKARMSKSKVKTMILAFFDNVGMVHWEFLPPGKTLTGAYYKQVLIRLNRNVKRRRPVIATSWKLHHDNAPVHTAGVVTDYLDKIGVKTLPQPPYSPDLSPPDFFLFPKLKRPLKGHRFDDVDAIQEAVAKSLKDIPESAFQEAFAAWKSRWQRCIDAQGQYFEEY